MRNVVTICNLRPNGEPGWLHGQQAELILQRYDELLEYNSGLALVMLDPSYQELASKKAYLLPLSKQRGDDGWTPTDAYSFSDAMSESDLDYWMTLIRLKST